ncbi:hypothetical protein KAW08_01190 [bacterium]|nr:hypothetical protein [bacterium]
MTAPKVKELQEELEQFRKEKEWIKNVIGTIGAKTSTKQDMILNISFISAVVILFVLDTMRHMLEIDIPLPPLFSIEIGLLLVSIKIIWMIRKQMKVEHFQFWILNSIEYRLNDVSKRLINIENLIKEDCGHKK